MRDQLIIAEEFCACHGIEVSFITSLTEIGLLETTVIEEKPFIPEHQLAKLEKLVRLHQDLNINLEGIDAIAHLLERFNQLTEENIALKNKLRYFEATAF